MQTTRSDWGLAIASTSLQKQSCTANACAAAAGAMLGAARPFIQKLGALYLSATNDVHRDAVIAVDPHAFHVFAKQAGHAWCAAEAGFTAPKPSKDLVAFPYIHDEFGALTCHMGVSDDAFFVAGAYLRNQDIFHRLTEQELSLIVVAFNKYLDLEREQEAMDLAADNAG